MYLNFYRQGNVAGRVHFYLRHPWEGCSSHRLTIGGRNWKRAELTGLNMHEEKFPPLPRISSVGPEVSETRRRLCFSFLSHSAYLLTPRKATRTHQRADPIRQIFLPCGRLPRRSRCDRKRADRVSVASHLGPDGGTNPKPGRAP